jgi:hypothetical protein
MTAVPARSDRVSTSASAVRADRVRMPLAAELAARPRQRQVERPRRWRAEPRPTTPRPALLMALPNDSTAPTSPWRTRAPTQTCG